VYSAECRMGREGNIKSRLRQGKACQLLQSGDVTFGKVLKQLQLISVRLACTDIVCIVDITSHK